MRLFFVLTMSIKRLRGQMGLAMVFVASVTLAIGTVMSVPLFADAVSRRILQQELLPSAGMAHDATIVVRFYAYPSPGQPLTVADADALGIWLAGTLVDQVGIPIRTVYMEVHSPRYQMMTRTGSSQLTPESIDGVYVVYADQVEDHVQVIRGASFGDGSAEETLAVWVNQAIADEYGLAVGDLFDLGDLYRTDIERVPVRIAGIWEARDPQGDFWLYTEQIWHYENILLTSRQGFETHIEPSLSSKSKFVSWRFALEGRKMNLSQAKRYIKSFELVRRATVDRLPGGGMDQAPTEYLMRGQQRKAALTLVLLGFSVPLILMTFYFMGTASAALVRYQAQELATLASRGGGRLQLLGLSAAETIIMLAVATPLGLGLGLLLARLLGYSVSFLRFVPREPMEVDLTSADWRLLCAILGAALMARVVPTWPATGVTIVAQGQRSGRQHHLVSAARLLGILALSLATAYAYYRLSQVGTLALVSWKPGDLGHDPLLLMAPSLLLLTGPLVLAELFVLLVPVLGRLGLWLPSVTGYLGCMSLGREGGEYRTPVYMLMLCLSLGMFYASLARTADAWLVDRRRYEIGSDLTFRPRVLDQREGSSEAPEDSDRILAATQLPMSDYEQIPWVEAAMPVGEYKASIVADTAHAAGRLLAIDRSRFPRIAYYRADYAKGSLGSLMNRLALTEEGILTPVDVAAGLHLSEGDRLRMNVVIEGEEQQTCEFVLVGSFDYFPTMLSHDEAVFVANLDYLRFQTSGVLAYGLWVRAASDADVGELKQAIVSRSGATLEPVGDLPTTLAEDGVRLERVGLFGMLTVSFAASVLLAAAGLLVHAAAAIRKRGLRFAVFQALGLTRKQMMQALFLEYAVTLIYGLVSGAVLGVLCARLYVPFYQIIETKGMPVPPYFVLIDVERTPQLAGLMVATLLVVGGMLLLRLRRLRVFETLRMGMHE